jgi:hypothetical protein
MRTVLLLTSNTRNGHDLAERVGSLAKEFSFRLSVSFGISLDKFASATFSGQLQIIDISMDEGANPFDGLAPMPSTRTLAVSRTHTPLNFRPRSAPISDSESGSVWRAFPEFGERCFTNDDLIAWLQRKLPGFLSQSGLRIPLLSTFLSMKASVTESYTETRRAGQIFLSYRSAEAALIQDVAQDIRKNYKKTCLYFPAGALTNEAMSRMRRWNLLSLLDRALGPAEEFWACLSDTYLFSWWTFGELVTATHRMTTGFGGHPGPAIRKYQGGHVSDWDVNTLPQISEAEHKRISRYYAFCDSFMMGPEGLITHEGLQELNLSVTRDYYADEVWRRDFWLNPIVECAECRKSAGGYSTMSIGSFLWHRGGGAEPFHIDADAATVSRGDGFIELNFDALPGLAKTGVRCECGNRIGLVPGPSQYLFVFAPPRSSGDVPVARQLARKWRLPECAVLGTNLLEIPAYLVGDAVRPMSPQI